MTQSTIRAARTLAARALPGALAAIAQVVRVVRRRVSVWRDLRRERAALSRLDARMLADIGLDTGDAAREADRPFWDMPPGR